MANRSRVPPCGDAVAPISSTVASRDDNGGRRMAESSRLNEEAGGPILRTTRRFVKLPALGSAPVVVLPTTLGFTTPARLFDIPTLGAPLSIGRVCAGGTVAVDEHPASVPHVPTGA